MAYRFKTSDKTVAAGMRRIAADQLDRAIASLDEAPDAMAGVHDARKRVKKVRGLLRLLRGSFAGYSAENGYLRDTGRLLSGLRDREALIETYDRVTRGAEVDRRPLGVFRRELSAERDRALADPETRDRVSTFRANLETVRGAVPDWDLKEEGWDAIAPGLAKTYGRLRDRMPERDRGGDAAAMHEWRKRAKYHWYHARLLQRIWTLGVAPQLDAADRLSKLLGDHHDLAVFETRLAASDLATEPKDALLGLLSDERARLEAELFPLGARLAADKPKALTRRWGTWWELRGA